MKQTLNEQIGRIKSMMNLITEQSSIIVSITGEQPYSTDPKKNITDWDDVHGYLGSAKMDDDLEQRVGDKLKQGNYRVVSVTAESYVDGDKVITDGEATLQADNNNPDIAFTTRGSIGENYVARHDAQVSGLVDRLSKYYKGDARKISTIIVPVSGTTIAYKQSFFAVSKNQQSNSAGQSVTIKGIDLDDLRAKISASTKNISIDVSSIKIDAPNFSVSYKPGYEQIKTMSFIWDNQGDLETRFANIKTKNPTIEKIENGTIQDIQWALSIIR
jgi:hypothetical protein